MTINPAIVQLITQHLRQRQALEAVRADIAALGSNVPVPQVLIVQEAALVAALKETTATLEACGVDASAIEISPSGEITIQNRSPNQGVQGAFYGPITVQNTTPSLSIRDLFQLFTLTNIGVKIFMTSDEAFEYLSQGLLRASLCIDQCAIANSIPISNGAKRIYNSAITNVIRANKVKYRYVAKFDRQRWMRTKKFITDKSAQKYYVGMFDIPIDIPMLSFIIIDEKEVIVRYPYEPDEPEVFLSIKHSEIIRLFLLYYQSLWRKCSRIHKNDTKKIEEIDSIFI